MSGVLLSACLGCCYHACLECSYLPVWGAIILQVWGALIVHVWGQWRSYGSLGLGPTKPSSLTPSTGYAWANTCVRLVYTYTWCGMATGPVGRRLFQYTLVALYSTYLACPTINNFLATPLLGCSYLACLWGEISVKITHTNVR